MKQLAILLAISASPIFGFSQDLSGLWQGTVYNEDSKESLQYEVYVTKNKGKYTGVSHTWFMIEGKKYYGVKNVQVRIAKDKKIVMQDDKLIADDYPILPPKKVRQLNVMDIGGDENSLEGYFVTIPTKEYKELLGKISLKKVSELSQSDLMNFLHKNDNLIATASK